MSDEILWGRRGTSPKVHVVRPMPPEVAVTRSLCGQLLSTSQAPDDRIPFASMCKSCMAFPGVDLFPKDWWPQDPALNERTELFMKHWRKFRSRR